MKKLILPFMLLLLLLPTAALAANVYIDGDEAYILRGENLFADPRFEDHSAEADPQWYVGTNSTAQWNGKIPNPATGENLIPLKGSLYIAEKETPRLFHYGLLDGVSCLSESITSATRCQWNGVDSLLGFVPIEPGKTYYFSVRFYASTGKSPDLRYGAIDPSSYCSESGAVTGLTDASAPVGDPVTVEGVFTPKAGQDWFMFNAYSLNRSENTSFTDFVLREAEGCDIGTAERIEKLGDYITDYEPSVIESTDSSGFIHPGITMTKADLDRMQRHVRAADEPWLSAFMDFAVLSKSNRNPRIYYGDASDRYNYETIDSEFVAIRLRYDSDTCFAQTIMWYITGDDVYRKNAMNIIRRWTTVKAIVHDDNRYLIDNEQLHFGVAMYKLSFAAEILRYSDYTKTPALVWTDKDTAAFTKLLELSYPKYNRWWHFMNQHAINNMAFMASAIFRGDSADFAAAVERTTVNSAYNDPRSGSIINVIREVTYRGQTNIQHCEMGRDQGHAYGDIGALSVCAMTAERQNARVNPVTGTLSESGISVFEFANHRLLFGANYISQYNLGFDVPFLPVEVGEKAGAMWYYSINNTNRGLLYPNIGILYNYYKYERGFNMDSDEIKYLTRAYELMLPEGESDDFLGNSTLLFSGDEALGTLPARDITPDTAMRKQLENRTRAVISGSAEVVEENNIAYLRFNRGGTTSFIADDFYPAYGSISLRLRTTAPARIEIRNSELSEEPFAVFDLPSTNGEWLTFTELMTHRDWWQRMTYFTVISDAATDLDWIEFSDDTDLPSARPEYDRTYSDQSRAYMYVGERPYVLAIDADADYSVECTMPFEDMGGYLIIRPAVPGVQKLYIILTDGQSLRCVCSEVYVFSDVEELIAKTTVNHRSGGSYTNGSMARYNAAAEALRAMPQLYGDDFVAAANALRLADDQNNLANIPGEKVEGPILHYDFSGFSHGKILDASPYGNDAAPVAVTLDGSRAIFADSGYVSMPEGLLAGSSEVTVVTTFETYEQATLAWLWGFSNSSEDGYIFFAPGRTDGKAHAAITYQSYPQETVAEAPAVPANKTVTAAVTLGGGQLRLYIDGVLAAQARVRLTPDGLGSTAMNYIGKSPYPADPAFNGSVSDFRVYNRALTADEVAAITPGEKVPALVIRDFTRDNSDFSYSVSAPGGANVFAALYSADGMLLDVCSGESGTLRSGSAALVKIFAWQPGSLEPAACAVITL